MKAPKDLSKYEEPRLSAGKLIELALQHILFVKPGIKVRWSLSVSYWNDDWLNKEKTKDMVCIGTHSTFSNKA